MVGTGNPLYTGNNLLQQILNSTETMIFWKDTQRRFVGVNQAFLNYYGFPDQSVLLGKTDEDMGWHSDPDPFANDEWRVLHEGIKTNLVHGKCMARGKERDILASKSPLYSGTEIVGLVGSFIDVTEHFQRLDEIERLHRRLDNVPGGIAVFKYYFDKIICISVNRHLTQMLGASPEDFLDKNLRQLAEVYMEPEERERYFKECPVLNKLAPSAEGTYRFRKGETAEPVWLHIICQLVREQAGQEFIYCAYTNVDKLIHYQNQLQENRRLAEKRYTYAMNMLNEGKERNLVSKGRYNFTTNKVLEYRYYIDQAFRVEQATYDDAFDKMMELSYLPQDREVLLKILRKRGRRAWMTILLNLLIRGFCMRLWPNSLVKNNFKRSLEGENGHGKNFGNTLAGFAAATTGLEFAVFCAGDWQCSCCSCCICILSLHYRQRRGGEGCGASGRAWQN